MKLFFRKLGEGKPLFILHGLFGLSDNWATIGKMLSDSFEVYLIDLRNHGNSPHSDEWTYSAMANDIKDVMEDVKGQMADGKIILIGHSLGGKVAMQFASMYPEKIEKLIVVDMAPKDYPGNQFDFIEKLLSINLSKMKSRKEAEVELRKIIRDEATIQLLLKNIQWKNSPPSPLFQKERGDEVGVSSLEWKFNLQVIAENQNKIGKTFSLGEKPINTPTLFIRGEKSNYILDSDIPQIKKYFPSSVPIAIGIKTIAGAGHWVHADKPKEFAEAVKEFIL
ncbi:MAG: alpha/beta fold hydrolase [Bacteroidetes bacterium]|nr:alpha/beta fold hydrolase [Bacteroidota bacterium]